MADEHTQAHQNDILDAIEQEADQDLHPLLKAILDNLQAIGIGIGAIILVVAAYSGYTTYTRIQDDKLANALGTILVEEDPAKRMTSLKQFFNEHPSAMPVGTLLEMAHAAMLAKDYPEAAWAWSRIADVTDGAVKVMALMGQAKALSLNGNYAKALTVLDTIDTATAADFTTPVARQVAFAAEQAQDWKKALAAYEILTTKGAVTNTAFLDMKIARIKANML